MSRNLPPPRIHFIQVRTHKLSVVLTLPPTTTIIEVKSEVLDALQSTPGTSALAEQDVEDEITVSSTSDFFLSRTVKQKAEKVQLPSLPPTIEAGELIPAEDEEKTLKELGLLGWEVLLVRFVDARTGEPKLATWSNAPFHEEEEEEEEDVLSNPETQDRMDVDDKPEHRPRRGEKRKASPEPETSSSRRGTVPVYT
ncbi:hypothetical protein DL96DRAFT_1582309 [Flagelloscypha sp. PMI_526]|nr:hypothetical protein DL96DRAFT_1582309 [Flagelloscypha sp. PMI_526]